MNTPEEPKNTNAEKPATEVKKPAARKPIAKKVQPAVKSTSTNNVQTKAKPLAKAKKNVEAKAVEIEDEEDLSLGGRSVVTINELKKLKTKSDLKKLFTSKNAGIKGLIDNIEYEEELEKLQIELVKMQRYIQAKGLRVAILFEGRDAAGKGGTIRRFTEHLNPRAMRVVALPKPTDEELGQWYFQRYTRVLPNRGEIVFFDRSWYNRAVVEPVNGFCKEKQYETFMQQVPEFEHMLYEDGIIIIKFWFSISKVEQLRRFQSRKKNLLKQWKLSPVDMEAQKKWDVYTKYKETMFNKTHTSFSPWVVVKANNKKKARLESIRYVLSQIQYEEKDKAKTNLFPNPNIINRFHRKARQVD